MPMSDAHLASGYLRVQFATDRPVLLRDLRDSMRFAEAVIPLARDAGAELLRGLNTDNAFRALWDVAEILNLLERIEGVWNEIAFSNQGAEPDDERKAFDRVIGAIEDLGRSGVRSRWPVAWDHLALCADLLARGRDAQPSWSEQIVRTFEAAVMWEQIAEDDDKPPTAVDTQLGRELASIRVAQAGVWAGVSPIGPRLKVVGVDLQPPLVVVLAVPASLLATVAVLEPLLGVRVCLKARDQLDEAEAVRTRLGREIAEDDDASAIVDRLRGSLDWHQRMQPRIEALEAADDEQLFDSGTEGLT